MFDGGDDPKSHFPSLPLVDGLTINFMRIEE